MSSDTRDMGYRVWEEQQKSCMLFPPVRRLMRRLNLEALV